MLMAVLPALALTLAACTTPPRPAPPTDAKPPGRPAAPAPATAPTGPRAATPPATPAAPAPAAPPPLVPTPPPPGPLAAEQRWLASLFDGTPVLVMSQANGQGVLVELPVRYAFDEGSAQTKPPLQAVLQRVGMSLKRHPTARLAVTAPPPGAVDRQRAMRAELAAMGLPLHRVSAAASLAPAAPDNAVRLHLALAPVAIQRLKDRDLPAATTVLAPIGIKP